MNNIQTFLCDLWNDEFKRTTGKSDRRMVYRLGWFKIQHYVEGIEGQVGTGWQNEFGSNYRQPQLLDMITVLKGRPTV